jgi:hypothetical protein
MMRAEQYQAHKTYNLARKVRFKKVFLFLPLLCLVLGIGFINDFPGLIRQFVTKPVTTYEYYPAVETAPIANVWAMIGEVDQQRMLTDLRKLTGVEQICLAQGCYTISNRHTGSEGLQWAKDYVKNQLVSLGMSVEFQSWTRENYSDENLIIKKLGSSHPEEEIYFVAHLDGENNPAADDNASGSVSLLELARVISHRQFEQTIVILFSTGEEQGTLGVYSYIEQLTPDELAAIKYVINVDMLGYDANKDGIMELFNGSQPLDFVQQLTGIITTYQIGLTPQVVSDCG